MNIDKSTYNLCKTCRKETLAKVIGEFGAIPETRIGLYARILKAEAMVVHADYEKSVAEHQELIKKVTPALRCRVENRRPTASDNKIVTRLGRLANNIETCTARINYILQKKTKS